MITSEEVQVFADYNHKIVELFEIRDEMPYSDFDGFLDAIILDIYREGKTSK